MLEAPEWWVDCRRHSVEGRLTQFSLALFLHGRRSLEPLWICNPQHSVRKDIDDISPSFQREGWRIESWVASPESHKVIVPPINYFQTWLEKWFQLFKKDQVKIHIENKKSNPGGKYLREIKEAETSLGGKKRCLQVSLDFFLKLFLIITDLQEVAKKCTGKSGVLVTQPAPVLTSCITNYSTYRCQEINTGTIHRTYAGFCCYIHPCVRVCVTICSFVTHCSLV